MPHFLIRAFVLVAALPLLLPSAHSRTALVPAPLAMLLLGSGMTPPGTPAGAPRTLVRDSLTGIPTAPTLVTVVPFYEKPDETADEQTKVVIPAAVDGHQGIFILDLGAPPFFLNRTFLQPSPTGGVDTVTDATRLPERSGEGPAGWDRVHVTLRIGTLVDDFHDPAMPLPNPHHLNAYLNHEWGNFSWNFAPRLGNLGLAVLEPFETIIDYTHRCVVLIRLNAAGHRLAAVPAYTPKWVVPLLDIPHPTSLGVLQYWGLAVGSDNELNLTDPRQNTEKRVIDTGNPENSGIFLGYPFLSQLGVVGFNHRTHQFMLYR